MKKLLLTIVLAALLTISMVGCGKDDNSTTATSSEEATTAQKEETIEFFKCTTLEEYQKEVHRRMKSEEEFLSEEECEFFEATGLKVRNSEEGYISLYDEMYHETKEYYYPILTSEGESTFLWYTSEYGDLYVSEFERSYDDTLELGLSDWISSAHYECTEGQKSLDEVVNWRLVYNESSGEIQKWFLGELAETYQVPAGSLEVGRSFWEGFVFRKGTDVYALRTEDNGWFVEVIAHNVAEVLYCDYPQTSDCWSQPMFLMTDGSVKVYVGWDGNQEKADDIDHLQDPIHEGGYH